MITHEPEYFDAFLSYHIDDQKFADMLTEKVEKEFGMKLCIPDRNMCIGAQENETTATLIRRRYKILWCLFEHMCICWELHDNR